MPRAVRRSASRRKAPTRGAVAFQPDEPRMLNEEEKRELILAHAAAREREPREWGIGYAIGLFATILVVVSGWALTFRQNIRARIAPGPDPLLEGTRERVGEALPSPGRVQGSVEEMRRAYQEAVTAERSRTTTSTPSTNP